MPGYIPYAAPIPIGGALSAPAGGVATLSVTPVDMGALRRDLNSWWTPASEIIRATVENAVGSALAPPRPSRPVPTGRVRTPSGGYEEPSDATRTVTYRPAAPIGAVVMEASEGKTEEKLKKTKEKTKEKTLEKTQSVNKNSNILGKTPNGKRPFFKGNWPLLKRLGYTDGSYVGNAARLIFRDVPATELILDAVNNGAGMIKAATTPNTEYEPKALFLKGNLYYPFISTLGLNTIRSTVKPDSVPAQDLTTSLMDSEGIPASPVDSAKVAQLRAVAILALSGGPN